jgi:hypothetical protein
MLAIAFPLANLTQQCPREIFELLPSGRFFRCAIAAAPYCHVKLKAIEHTGQEGGPVEQKVVLTFD